MRPAFLNRAITGTMLPWVLAVASIAARPVLAQAPDRDGVTRAALDYIAAFYEGDSTRFIRSVRPEFSKSGFGRPADSTTYTPQSMTWAQAMTLMGRIRSGQRVPPPNAPRGVDILDLQDQTAAVKVTAYWGTDYLLMGRYQGRWMIAHVLWQSSPPSGADGAGPRR